MSRYEVVPGEPAGSDDIARPVELQLSEVQRELLSSLSDEEIGEFVRQRDALTDTLRLEHPLMPEQDLNALVAERMKPVILEWMGHGAAK